MSGGRYLNIEIGNEVFSTSATLRLRSRVALLLRRPDSIRVLFSVPSFSRARLPSRLSVRSDRGACSQPERRRPAEEGEPAESLAFTLEAIRLLRRELEVPLIGFAGAPFTLASYAIEGGPSKSFEKTKALMYEDPDTWHLLLSKLATTVRDYLTAQIEAGVSAVQLFDSWVGALAPEDYRKLVLPHSRAILEPLEKLGVPRIHFGTGTSGILRELREAGGDVIGLDWRIDLDRGWEQLGDGVAVQGNLDPVVLLAPREVLCERVDLILRQAAGRPGHVFNLGHGILPGTPVENVQILVDRVHQHRPHTQ
jgi:uroporphyrinogen decarboxylase